MALLHEKKGKRLQTHLQFFFTKGGGVFIMIHSPFDDEEYNYHLVSLVNHEILESYDDLPTLEQIKEEIGEFDCIHTDDVTVEEMKKSQ